MKKVLVTGVAGFIGSAIAHDWLKRGHQVVGIDSITDYYSADIKLKRLDELRLAGAEVLVADLLEVSLETLLEGVQIVFHEAGQPGVRLSWGQDFEKYTQANIAVSQKLLEQSARTDSLERFVYASSSSVYGDAISYPTSENDLPRPMSPYGVTKLAAEHLCNLYARNYQVPTVSLRYFTVYGPGQRPDMAFNKFITAAIKGEPIPVYGDGRQIRDFTYITDVVEANRAAVESELPPGTVLNVCGGSSVSVLETLSIIEKAIGRTVDIEWLPKVPGDVFQTGGDSTRIREKTGWKPQVGIEEGITAEANWLAGLN